MALGEPIVRDTARAKVTGAIDYSIDAIRPRMVHARLVGATIPKGTITAIDRSAALAVPGVLAVLTHDNMPQLNDAPSPQGGQPPVGLEGLMQNARIRYAGETVALVVAETDLAARDGAFAVRATYDEAADALTALDREQGEVVPAAEIQTEAGREVRGEPDGAFESAVAKVDVEYRTPVEHQNPIGLFATLAHWEAPDRLFLHDASQAPHSSQEYVAQTLGVPIGQVRAISPYVGGAFGASIRPRQHVVLAAVAAREVNRPVRLALSREDMFTKIGHRSPTIQRMRVGADADGRLEAIIHEGLQHATAFNVFKKDTTAVSRMLYAAPNVRTSMEGRRVNMNTASWMRAPGEAPGCFALECALDELAREQGIDPVELRLRNHADTDPETGKPFSSKSLREAYRLAESEFGWSDYSPAVGSQASDASNGRLLVGWGMASATYPAFRFAGGAEVTLFLDGSATVRTGQPDIGPGAYTAFKQIAAEHLGLPEDRVTVRLGDSAYPNTFAQGASSGTSSTGAAVHEACEQLVRDLIAALPNADTPLRDVDPTAIAVADGGLASASDPSVRADWGTILGATMQTQVAAQVRTPMLNPATAERSSHAFGAIFVEVTVDPDTMEARVPRMVGAYGIGRAINPRMVRSQLEGAMGWGIGMALMEETVLDPNLHRMVNTDLGEYHVPVCADVRQLKGFVVPEDDAFVNPMGAKGCGEIALVGTAAALANAVYHATGIRVRELPITPAKLFAGMA